MVYSKYLKNKIQENFLFERKIFKQIKLISFIYKLAIFFYSSILHIENEWYSNMQYCFKENFWIIYLSYSLGL